MKGSPHTVLRGGWRPVGGQRFGALLAGAVVVLALAIAPTNAFLDDARSRTTADPPAVATIIIDLGGAANGYTTPNVDIAQGGIVTVVNNDGIAHTVTSDAVGTDGDPLFNVLVPARTTRSLTIAGLAGGAYAFYCAFHPTMRGTLNIVGGPLGEVPATPAFEQPLRIPDVLTGRNITIPMRMGKVRVMANGPKTRMWTYAGSFPGPTIKRPTGQETK